MNRAALAEIPVLLRYQVEFFEDRSPVKIAVKSRRIGISWSTALEAVMVAATSRAAGGSDVFYLSQSIRDSKEFTVACGNFARYLNIAYDREDDVNMILDDGESSIRVTQITFSSGFRILLLPGTRPDALRGKQGVAIFDEAALLNIPDCLAAAEAFSMWGGRVVFISTQASEENGFNTDLLDVADSRGWSVHTIDIHQAVNDGLYRRICLVRGLEWKEENERSFVADLLKSPRAGQEYLCIPGISGDVYMPRSLVESRCVPEAKEGTILSLKLPAKWEMQPDAYRSKLIDAWISVHLKPALDRLNKNCCHSWGLDFGRSADGDLSVFWLWSIQSDMVRTTPFVIEMTGVPFDEQETILFAAIDALPRHVGGKADRSGNGMSIAEHLRQRYGELLVEGVPPTRKWYAENLPDYRAAFLRGEILIPKNSDIVRDHSVFEVDDATNLPMVGKRKTKGDRGEMRHGDSAIAGLLGYSASKGQVHYETGSSPPTRGVSERSEIW